MWVIHRETKTLFTATICGEKYTVKYIREVLRFGKRRRIYSITNPSNDLITKFVSFSPSSPLHEMRTKLEKGLCKYEQHNQL